jgi:hypothetical protein
VLAQIYPIDCEEAVRYWSYGTEEEDEAEEEAAINGQETEDIEDQIQVHFSEQSDESGRESQEEKVKKRREAKRREAMQRLQGRARRVRLRWSLLCPPQQV